MNDFLNRFFDSLIYFSVVMGKVPNKNKRCPKKPQTRRQRHPHDLDPEQLQKTLAECKPYSDGSLRKIPGYYLTRFAFVKGRWLGKSLAEIYEVEFSTKITDSVIKHRNLSINGEPAQSPHVKMKQNYYIESTVHFHEKPVIF